MLKSNLFKNTLAIAFVFISFGCGQKNPAQTHIQNLPSTPPPSSHTVWLTDGSGKETQLQTVTSSAESEILKFFKNEKTLLINNQSYTCAQLNDLFNSEYSDTAATWENTTFNTAHNFIQWLFPITQEKGSPPHLSANDLEAFHTLQATTVKNLKSVLPFYGIDVTGLSLSRPHLRLQNPIPAQLKTLLNSPGKHNFLRISRILTHLSLVQLTPIARELLKCLTELESYYASTSLRTTMQDSLLQHWNTAIYRKVSFSAPSVQPLPIHYTLKSEFNTYTRELNNQALSDHALVYSEQFEFATWNIAQQVYYYKKPPKEYWVGKFINLPNPAGFSGQKTYHETTANFTNRFTRILNKASQFLHSPVKQTLVLQEVIFQNNQNDHSIQDFLLEHSLGIRSNGHMIFNDAQLRSSQSYKAITHDKTLRGALWIDHLQSAAYYSVHRMFDASPAETCIELEFLFQDLKNQNIRSILIGGDFNASVTIFAEDPVCIQKLRNCTLMTTPSEIAWSGSNNQLDNTANVDLIFHCTIN